MTTFLVSFAAGLLGWTLLEYAIHYWLGHLPKGRILISSEHLAHHRDILYFTPLRMKIRGAVPVLAGVFLIVSGTCGLTVAGGFVTALAVGWTAYERLHQSIHVRGPRTAYGRWAARHHLSHHFGLPNANHGVTTPIWDIVFGTYLPVRPVQVPKRFEAAVPWLGGESHPGREVAAFLADYERF